MIIRDSEIHDYPTPDPHYDAKGPRAGPVSTFPFAGTTSFSFSLSRPRSGLAASSSVPQLPFDAAVLATTGNDEQRFMFPAMLTLPRSTLRVFNPFGCCALPSPEGKSTSCCSENIPSYACAHCVGISDTCVRNFLIILESISAI